MAESVTTAGAYNITQPCVEDPGNCTVPSVTQELDHPVRAGLNLSKTVGPIPGPNLTITLHPAAGAGIAVPPVEADTPAIVPAEPLQSITSTDHPTHPTEAGAPQHPSVTAKMLLRLHKHPCTSIVVL